MKSLNSCLFLICFSISTSAQIVTTTNNTKTLTESREERVKKLSALFGMNTDSLLKFDKIDSSLLTLSDDEFNNLFKNNSKKSQLFNIASTIAEIRRTLKTIFTGDISDQLKKAEANYKTKITYLDSNKKATTDKLVEQRNTGEIDSKALKEKMIEVRKQYNTDKDSIKQIRNDIYGIIYEDWREEPLRSFPARNYIFANLFYNNDKYKPVQGLGYGYLQTNFDGSYSLYSEFISSITPFPPFFRVGLGSLLSSTNISKLKASALSNASQNQIDSMIHRVDSLNRKNGSVNRLLSGGGNAMLMVQLPAIIIESNSFEGSATLFDKVCGEVPVMNSEIDKPGYQNGIGVQIDTKLKLSQTIDFGLTISTRGTFIRGTQQFYENLGIDKKSLFLYEIKGGVYLGPFFIAAKWSFINAKSIQSQTRWAMVTEILPF